MAEASIEQGKHAAVGKWNEALRINPEDAHLEQGLEHALWLDNDLATAEPLLARLLMPTPESAELNFELGDTLLQSGLTAKARLLLERR